MVGILKAKLEEAGHIASEAKKQRVLNSQFLVFSSLSSLQTVSGAPSHVMVLSTVTPPFHLNQHSKYPLSRHAQRPIP